MAIQATRTFILAVTPFMLLASVAWAAQDAADGGKIFEENCATCHRAGLMGAPKVGDTADWQARLKSAGSVAGLLAITTRGKDNMPPRGGEQSLSDAELTVAIQYMLDKSGIDK